MDHKDLHGLTLDLHPQVMVLNRKFQREIRKRREWCKLLQNLNLKHTQCAIFCQITKTGSQRKHRAGQETFCGDNPNQIGLGDTIGFVLQDKKAN